MTILQIGYLILLAALNGFLLDGAHGQETPTKEAVPVTVNFLSQVIVYPSRESPASVESLNDSQISPEVSSKIVELPVEVGDLVDEDAVLAKLDNRDYHLQMKTLEAKMKQVDAQRELLSWEYGKEAKLQQATQKSAKEMETKRTVLDQEWQEIRVMIEQAERNIEKCMITAPFDGLLVERFGKVGEVAVPGKPLLRFLDVSHIEVSAQLQSSDVESLRSATKIEFSYQNERYPLILRTIIPVRDPKTRTQEARLTFVKERALPGTPGRMIWTHNKPHVPPNLVVRRKGQLGIFIHKKGIAHFTPLAQALEGRPAAIGELPLNSHIITQGLHSLGDKDPIRAAE